MGRRNTISTLSRRRAESVKSYLVGVLGINPAQIETRGLREGKFAYFAGRVDRRAGSKSARRRCRALAGSLGTADLSFRVAETTRDHPAAICVVTID